MRGLARTSASGLEPGDSCTVTVRLTDGKDNVNVGTFTYTAEDVSNANYMLPDNKTSPAYTITPKPITVTPTTGQKKTYGEPDPDSFTYTLDALSADAVSGALSRAKGEIYSENGYAFTLGTLTAGSNYELKLADDAPTFLIEKKAVTLLEIAVMDKDACNGKTDDVVFADQAVFDGLCKGDVLTISNIEGQYISANAGDSQKVKFTKTPDEWVLEGDDAANYQLANDGHVTYTFGKVQKAAQSAPAVPTVSGETVTINEADYGKKLEYSLDGTDAWYSVPDASTSFTVSGLTEGSHTIFLHVKENNNYKASPAVSQTFELVRYSVAYNANGGVGSIGSQTANSGSTVTVKSGSGFSRTGYTFTGWNDEGGTAYAIGSTVGTGMTLYAQWEANTYTVKFNANGGTGTMENEEFTYDGSATELTDNAFTRENYTFVGWATNANGPVLYSDKQKVMNLTGSGTVTLYAIWAQTVHSISANFTSPQSGEIQIRLQQGDAVMKETDGSYAGACTLTGIPSGIYNFVVTQKQADGNTVTITKSVVLTDNQDVTVAIPEKGISSMLKVEQGTLPVIVGGLEAEAEKNRQNDKNITMRMAVSGKTEQQLAATAGETSKATQDAVSAIKTVAGDKALEFITIELEKTITDGSAGSVTAAVNETETVLELVFPYEMTGKGNITIYREHDGDVQEFSEDTTKQDGTFYLDTTNHLIYARRTTVRKGSWEYRRR